MACLIRQVRLLQIGVQPILQQTRSNGSLFKRKPKVKILHYKKAELLSVLKPQFVKEEKPMWETCGHLNKVKQEEIPLTQYETVLKRDMMNRFKHATFIAVLDVMPISGLDMRRAEVYFGRKQMTLKRYSHRVVKQGIRDTVYANLTPLFHGQTYLLFCAQPTIREMLGVCRKYPQFTVLGGYLEGRLVSRTQMDEYMNLPNLEASRVKLLGILNSAALQLVRNIETNQTVLVSHLESRAEELRKSQGSQESKSENEVSDKAETSTTEVTDRKS